MDEILYICMRLIANTRNVQFGQPSFLRSVSMERLSRNKTGKKTAFEVGQYSGSQPARPLYKPFGTLVGTGTIPRRGSKPQFHPVLDEMYGDDWKRGRNRGNAGTRQGVLWTITKNGFPFL